MAAESYIVAADGTVVASVWTCDYRFYLLGGDRMEMVHEIEAFCWKCGDYVPSEHIRTTQHCVAEIRWFTSLGREDRAKWEFICGGRQAVMERNRADIKRWRSRQSPPRCLECGSTSILQAELDERGRGTGRLMHPDYLPEGLVIELHAFVSTCSFYRLYSLEGEELVMSTEEIVETVNRCHGKPVCCMKKDGRLFYGESFPNG